MKQICRSRFHFGGGKYPNDISLRESMKLRGNTERLPLYSAHSEENQRLRQELPPKLLGNLSTNGFKTRWQPEDKVIMPGAPFTIFVRITNLD